MDPGLVVDRARLIGMVGETDEARRRCRQALEGGARFAVWDDALPATHLARTYSRRERLSRTRGTPSVGGREAVDFLQLAEDLPICIGFVETADSIHRFQLFLAEDLSGVVACIYLDRSHRHRVAEA